jgi:hypothetical protein
MKLDILAFAAHPDDVELSASATIMRHIEKGYKVGIVDLTQGELGSRGSVETRYDEAAASGEIIGLSARVNLKMDDGFFEVNEVNKRKIIEQIRRFQPKICIGKRCFRPSSRSWSCLEIGERSLFSIWFNQDRNGMGGKCSGSSPSRCSLPLHSRLLHYSRFCCRRNALFGAQDASD